MIPNTSPKLTSEPATPDGAEMTRFTSAMKHILAIPKTEILRREAEYKAKADQNPKKRGPKRKG